MKYQTAKRKLKLTLAVVIAGLIFLLYHIIGFTDDVIKALFTTQAESFISYMKHKEFILKMRIKMNETVKTSELKNYVTNTNSKSATLQSDYGLILEALKDSSISIEECSNNWVVTLNASISVRHLQHLVNFKLCVIIVGDYRLNYIPARKNSIILNPKMQSKLGYKTAFIKDSAHLNSKNIGYLLAIHLGAHRILDLALDGNYESISFAGKVFPLSTKTYNCRNAQYLIPKDITDSSKNPFSRLCSFRLEPVCDCQPGIIQFINVFNLDLNLIASLFPEMWLSQSSSCLKNFKSYIVPNSAYAYFNSQATLFHKHMFWSLFLPTPQDGARNILRSTLAHHLMPIVPGSCTKYSFIGNPTKDMPLRGNLSSQWNSSTSIDRKPLLRFLQSRSFSSLNIENELLHIYLQLSERGVIHIDHVKSVHAWIEDLKHVGYSLPKLKLKVPPVGLCLQFHHQTNEEVFNLLLRYYSIISWKDYIFVTGPNISKLASDNTAFAECESFHGYYSQRCAKLCFEHFKERSDISGILYINDDILFNWNLLNEIVLERMHISFNFSAFIDIKEEKDENAETWGKTFFTTYKEAVKNLPFELKKVLVRTYNTQSRAPGKRVSDIWYIPKHLLQRALNIMIILDCQDKLFSEYYLPLLLLLTCEGDHEVFKRLDLWRGGRKFSRYRFLSYENDLFAGKIDYIHPIKLSATAFRIFWINAMNKIMRMMQERNL